MRRVGAVFQRPIVGNSLEALAPQEAIQARGATIIDLTADDEKEQIEHKQLDKEEETNEEDTKEEDAKEDYPQIQTDQDAPRVRTALRNRPLDATHQSKQAFEVNGTRYSVGQFVELTEPEADYGVSRSTTQSGRRRGLWSLLHQDHD